MKRNYLYYLLVVMLLAVSCEKDEKACTTTVETQEASSIAATTAQCGGVISSDGNPTIKEAGVEWCTTSDFKSNVSCSPTAKAKLGKFACDITDLKDNTQYYIRAYARNSYGTIYGKVLSFKTLEIVLPVVLTDSVTSITISSATVRGEVTDESNGVVTERGIVYSTNPNPTVENSKVVCGSGKGAFSCNLTDLQDGVTYHVRAYAVNEKGTAYGEEKSFTTTAITIPTVTTSSATSISYTSATVGGNVTDDGGSNVTARGIVYSTTPNPTTANSKVASGSGKGAFTCNLSNLQAGVKYYIRAYAANQKGTAYGEEKSFTTKAITLPTVTTSPATNILSTSATVGGNVTDDGGSNVTARGIVYSTTPNPTTANNKVASGSGKGAFTCNLSNLQAGVKYYIRAYAVNQKGTSYGEEKSFTTKENSSSDPTIKVVTVQEFINAPVSDVVYYELTGTITDLVNTTYGNFDLTDETGTVYVWGLTKSFIAVGTTENDQSFASLGLNEGDKITIRGLRNSYNGKPEVHGAYFVRLVNKGDGGNTNITIPTVTTSSAPNISYTSASVGGNVTDDGGANVTERGVVYSTSRNPTTSNNKVVNGSGTGSFSCSLNYLQEGTTYYVRAYAINAKGTAYGEEISFTTKKNSAPKTIVFDANVDKGDGTTIGQASSYIITKDGVSIDVSWGLIETYSSNAKYRIYANETLTVTSTTGNITSVKFTCSGSGSSNYSPDYFTASTGSYNTSSYTGTWTGSASKVVFTASKQVRATEIEVVVE